MKLGVIQNYFTQFLNFLKYHLAFIWDISKLSIQYTAKILDKKEVLFPQDNLDQWYSKYG